MAKRSGIAIKLNKAKLEELERECPGRADRVVQKIAQDVEAYAKDHMSAQSPSNPGDPPGVVSGDLKNTIIAEPHESLPNTWVVRDGVIYGWMQEFGTVNMPERPFFLPAIEAVAADIPDELLESVVK